MAIWGCKSGGGGCAHFSYGSIINFKCKPRHLAAEPVREPSPICQGYVLRAYVAVYAHGNLGAGGTLISARHLSSLCDNRRRWLHYANNLKPCELCAANCKFSFCRGPLRNTDSSLGGICHGRSRRMSSRAKLLIDSMKSLGRHLDERLFWCDR